MYYLQSGAAVLRHEQLPAVRGEATARANYRQNQLASVPEGILIPPPHLLRYIILRLTRAFHLFSVLFASSNKVSRRKFFSQKLNSLIFLSQRIIILIMRVCWRMSVWLCVP